MAALHKLKVRLGPKAAEAHREFHHAQLGIFNTKQGANALATCMTCYHTPQQYELYEAYDKVLCNMQMHGQHNRVKGRPICGMPTHL